MQRMREALELSVIHMGYLHPIPSLRAQGTLWKRQAGRLQEQVSMQDTKETQSSRYNRSDAQMTLQGLAACTGSKQDGYQHCQGK